MDGRLRTAAQSGNIDALYAVIKDDADIFRRIDQRDFVDTPLHIAAAAGHTDFAMEMINLKPSFARKLNQDGFSPIHLALQNQHKEMVVDLLSVDKHLVRVKGREGYTPLHYIAREGNGPLLSQFLDHCPNCILDLTIRKETALHIAARFNRLEAVKAILEWILKTTEGNQFQRRRILNLQDKDGNTALHIAASNNQPQMMEMLTNCEEVDRNKVNQSGLAALDVLQRQTLVDFRENVKILTRSPSRFSKISEKELINHIKEMKVETINALLIVFALIITMTYQAIFNPPGGLSRGDAAAGSSKEHEGKSVLNNYSFLWFYISNEVAFFMAWIITLALLGVVANKSIISFVFPLYILMSICYSVAVGSIAPSSVTAFVALVSGSMICILMYYICLYRLGN